MNIRNGENPDMNTGRATQPTPLDTAATDPMKGAIDHMSQDMRLGLTWPLNIERMYR